MYPRPWSTACCSDMSPPSYCRFASTTKFGGPPQGITVCGAWNFSFHRYVHAGILRRPGEQIQQRRTAAGQAGQFAGGVLQPAIAVHIALLQNGPPLRDVILRIKVHQPLLHRRLVRHLPFVIAQHPRLAREILFLDRLQHHLRAILGERPPHRFRAGHHLPRAGKFLIEAHRWKLLVRHPRAAPYTRCNPGNPAR